MVAKDAQLLRQVDRLLKGAEQEIAPYLTTADQRKAITRSRGAMKKGKVRTAAEVDKAVRGWLAK
jgi:hypothetical protein